MYEFIILGLVPGTHIQITFLVWFLLACVITFGIVCHRALNSVKLRQFIVVYYLFVRTKKLTNVSQAEIAS